MLRLGIWFVLGLGISRVLAGEEFQPAAITVPEGYTVDVVAAPPLVKHPIMAGFDPQGRLYVAETAGLNLPRAELEQQLPNFVRRLEDTDGDGVFDRSTIFADKLTFPQGALFHDGALYVASSGNIWKFIDKDDDGVADERVKLVSQFGYTGNAADVHGCFLGPEGRIYWCEGRHGHEITDDKGEVISQGKAARIFSCLPDGSDLRVHCGGGMDNPVEIDFLPTGEIVGTVNILLNPRGDCLVHWMHGGNYPRHDVPTVTAEFPRTGELLPPIHNFGHVAVSGTCRYRSGNLSPEFRNQFFVTEFNTHKLQRVGLRRDGATFSAQVETFASCTLPDFHPTDVLEDAAGDLLLIDTGGWFRIGCPTSQIAKPNVLGAIYRIRRTGANRVANARGENLDWEHLQPAQLAALLVDARWAVRERAAVMLAAAKPEQALAAIKPLLATEVAAEVTSQALWILAQWNQPEAWHLVQQAFRDTRPDVRLTAVTAVGRMRYAPALVEMLPLLNDPAPEVRREVATAAGQIGDAKAAPAILDALAQPADRMLEHALLYALIELNNAEATRPGLAATHPAVRRGALIALDQMASQPLRREDVASVLNATDAGCQNAALEIISRRQGWAGEIVALVGEWLQSPELTDDRKSLLLGVLVGLRNEPAVQKLVADSLVQPTTPLATRKLLLEVAGRCDLEPYPAAWTEQIVRHLKDADPQLIEAAVAACGALKDVSPVREYLLKVARNAKWPTSVRVQALAMARLTTLEPADWQFLKQGLSGDEPPLVRLAAARVIGASQLTEAQFREAADLIANLGPLELPGVLPAFEKNQNSQIGLQLASSLGQSPGLMALSGEQLQKVLAQYPAEVQTAAVPLMERLSAGLAEQKSHLDQLEKELPAGDAQRGGEIFRSTRTACIACHQVQQAGGKVGPALTQVGQRRNRRDLLEAILFPSSSLVRGYESVTLALDDGRVLSGLIVRESLDEFWLRTSDQQEVRVRRSEVEDLQPHKTSIMPAGLEKTMSREQLADLLAYLQSL